MTAATGFMKFEDVVRDICSMAYDDEAGKYFTKVARAVRVTMEEIHLHLLPSIRSASVEILDNCTATLPNDCGFVVKVGVCVDGKIRILGRDDKLCIPSKSEIQVSMEKCCECSEDSVGATCESCTFHNVAPETVLFGYQYIGQELYGYSPRQFLNGTYRVDSGSNRLILGRGYDIEPGGFLVVEYKSTLNSSDFQLIPREAFNAIYFRTMDLLNFERDPNKSAAQFQRFKMEYYRLKDLYQTRHPLDWIAAIQSGYKSTPKR